MEILENREQWQISFKESWLAHYQQTGTIDWDLYPHPRNSTAPSSPGIAVSKSRLMLVSSAGGYLPDQQEPFDAANLLGDYSVRLFPSSTPLEALGFAHEHYDLTAVKQDPQVLLPLRHLEDLVNEGAIGELTPSVASFMGYQPDVTRVVDETIPPIVKSALSEKADAVLLVPS
jgi:hypothetical protein